MNQINLDKKALYLISSAAIFIIIAGLGYTRSIIEPLFIALFIVIIISQPIAWLQKRKIPKGLAILIVLSAIITSLLLLAEVISISFSSFSKNLPFYEQKLNSIKEATFLLFEKYGLQVADLGILKTLDPEKLVATISGYLSDFGDVLGNSFTIIFLTIFLLFEIESVPVKLNAIFKDKKDSYNFLDTIGSSIRRYLSIKTNASILTGILVWIGLKILGVDYAILWALITFLLNYIPNIGSIIAALPAILFSLVQLGIGGAIWTSVIFLVANMVIGNVVEPRMMGKGLGLSIFVVFLSLIFWGFLFGTTGMFLSVPLTMAVKITFEQFPGTKWIAILLGTEKDALEISKN